MTGLFKSAQLGSLTLSNRVFMAPLTRNRADANGVPGALATTYYEQRASAGLIVTEATQISPMGKGYINTPGIHSPAQVRAWSRIVESVHKIGGESSFSCGMSAESLIRPYCQTTRNRLLHPQSVPIARRSLSRVRHRSPSR